MLLDIASLEYHLSFQDHYLAIGLSRLWVPKPPTEKTLESLLSKEWYYVLATIALYKYHSYYQIRAITSDG